MLWYHLVRRSSYCILKVSKWRAIVLGHSRDAEGALRRDGASLSRARRVKTVNLEDVFARAAYKRPSATLVGNCQLGSLTTGSPAGHLLLRVADSRVSTTCSSLAPKETSLRGGRQCRIAIAGWWLNVQSGLQDPGNNTPGILQSV